MTRKELVKQIFEKRSYLCVGLDTDISLIPPHLLPAANPVFEFNKAIIDATKDSCVAYKINTAFYEAMGTKGWEALEQTVNYIPSSHFKIADAKRGDIGNTSSQYARAFFDTLPFDSITIAPYMGEDSVKPFLQYSGKWAIVLGLTSNSGAADFELQKIVTDTEKLEEGIHITKHQTAYLYETVLRKVSGWGNPENLMFVVGATRAEEFINIRKITPTHFYLVPGVGAQGGSLQEISEKAMIHDCGLLVNVSRAIIYASSGNDFAAKAKKIAEEYQQEMSIYLKGIKPA
jgi:orotidine-5'-phosphate decarboxylase